MTEDEIELNVFSPLLKKSTLRKAIVHLFPPLFLAKTRGRMTTATMYSRQNNAGPSSRPCPRRVLP